MRPRSKQKPVMTANGSCGPTWRTSPKTALLPPSHYGWWRTCSARGSRFWKPARAIPNVTKPFAGTGAAVSWRYCSSGRWSSAWRKRVKAGNGPKSCAAGIICKKSRPCFKASALAYAVKCWARRTRRSWRQEWPCPRRCGRRHETNTNPIENVVPRRFGIVVSHSKSRIQFWKL